MALGVLNNLSAIYAENNLNNTSNSLQTVLQQLSSGSRINSGADDAAGLSLVNGLGANSVALTQSKTNATEGVGLLQVADGALSQVTSLLDRAITLATEASNGTLNTNQDGAANQEYQSILAEINNIGSTTTFNQEQVFAGNTIAIYTGDSSAAGSSIDNLNIRSLSSSSVGDTSGKMSYSSGTTGNSVFIDLGTKAQGVISSDFLGSATGTSESVTVETLTSSGTTVTTTIATGGATGYTNTVGGLIQAINNSGLGITANLTSGNVAGDLTAGTDSGIEINGSVGVGNSPSTSSFSGTMTAVKAAGDTLTGSITLKEGTGATTTVTMNQVTTAGYAATVAGLAGYITADTALGVTATGTTTLALSSTGSTNALTVNSNLIDNTTSTSLNYTSTPIYSVGVSASTAADYTATTSAAAAAVAAGITSSSTGIATMSYTDSAGQSLSSTDLSNSADAQSALNDLNVAITDIASMDGYIGAQINTLNSLSQVMSTQQENVVSAQNAIQATDYASATSNMSKYEILSQTGIAALAQANSVEQEVTKLLQ